MIDATHEKPELLQTRSLATLRLFESSLRRGELNTKDSVLVVGAGEYERELFGQLGFRDVHYSTPHDAPPSLAQHLPFPDVSYDLVFTEAVLHHLDRPHAAIYEMVRVSRRSVVIAESQENLLAKLMLRLGLMEVYEQSAVRAHEGTSGGVNDSAIPNYVYRWRPGELEKVFRSLDASQTPWTRCEFAWIPYQYGGFLGKLAAAAGNTFWRKAGNTFCLHYDKTRGVKHPWVA